MSSIQDFSLANFMSGFSVPKEKCCCCFNPCFDIAEKSGKKSYGFFKKLFCLPEEDDRPERHYSYYNDIWKPKIDDSELIYGHKAFFWPREKPKYTFSAKGRINFSLTLQYAPIIALLVDFFCDVNYLGQIALYTDRNLLDKHIQIDRAALYILCIWDIFRKCSFILTLF